MSDMQSKTPEQIIAEWNDTGMISGSDLNDLTGTVVRLKSGGPWMTIGYINSNGDCTVWWFEENLQSNDYRWNYRSQEDISIHMLIPYRGSAS